MNCTHCNSSYAIRKGLRNNKQRFYCKDCKRSFQSEYTYQAYKSETDNFIKSLLKEGCGVRGISRVLNISKNTVLSRILKISKQIKIPYFHKLGCKFEVDEMWSFIGYKKNVTWITYALERETKSIIDFYVGRKPEANRYAILDLIQLVGATLGHEIEHTTEENFQLVQNGGKKEEEPRKIGNKIRKEAEENKNK